MYWNVIDDNRKDILKKLTNGIKLKNYYMAGGTALALQMGTRESFDFDFFVMEKFDTSVLAQELEKIGELNVTYISESTLHCILHGVQLTFLYFPNSLVDELVEVENFDNLFLASIRDIAVMKLVAISQRGTKKDFFDLYNICKTFNYSVNDIFKLLDIKYEKEKLNYFHIAKSLVYFEDAEDEILPKTYVDIDWLDVKKFYMEEIKKIDLL